MPLQNRVTPLGELIATPARGLVFGNRGRLHDDQGRIRRASVGKRWIACRLEFRGRYHGTMPPGRYTGLFFLDEATAFAAGHRPCAECRHEDYLRFAELCGARADAIDARLHGERRGPRHERRLDTLPDGAFVLHAGEPWLVLGAELLHWRPSGYDERLDRPSGSMTVITPALVLEVLGAGRQEGSVPMFHPSASDTSIVDRPAPLTVSEVAVELDCSDDDVRALIREGELETVACGVRPGLIPRHRLDDYLRRRRRRVESSAEPSTSRIDHHAR